MISLLCNLEEEKVVKEEKILKIYELTTVTTTTTTAKETLAVTDNDEAQEDRVINTYAEVSQFMQTLKFKGRSTTLYYKDSKIQKLDNELVRKIYAKENPGMDFEHIRQMEENNLLQDKLNTDAIQVFKKS